jgi:hypothetical protein
MSASHVINSSLKPTTQTTVAVPKRKRGTKPSEVNLLKLACQAGGFESKKAAQECFKNAGFIATYALVGPTSNFRAPPPIYKYLEASTQVLCLNRIAIRVS